jgi:hypothetical protein
MTEMHTIEITDGGHTAPVFSTQIVETADNLHLSLFNRIQSAAL